MPKLIAVFTGALLVASAAHAQQSGSDPVNAFTVGELVSQGFEIKAAAPNGNRYVVFMQNDKSAYACEFVNVTTTRCRQIN